MNIHVYNDEDLAHEALLCHFVLQVIKIINFNSISTFHELSQPIEKKISISIQTNKESSSVIINNNNNNIVTIINYYCRELKALITTFIEKLEKQMKNFYRHILAVISTL